MSCYVASITDEALTLSHSYPSAQIRTHNARLSGLSPSTSSSSLTAQRLPLLSLDDVMTSTTYRAALKSFMYEEHGAENLEFVEQVGVSHDIT